MFSNTPPGRAKGVTFQHKQKSYMKILSCTEILENIKEDASSSTHR
jgi:hypothetical protein